MKDNSDNTNLLVELEEEAASASAEGGWQEEPEPKWNGSSGKFSLAVWQTQCGPVRSWLLRRGEVVAAGDPCQDCGQEGHQFHVKASKVPGTNRYAGPDAAHLEELIRGGMKRSSPEALEHAHELDRVLVLRRAVAPRKGDTCPNCKEPLSFNEKGKPDLACKCGVRAWFPEFVPPGPEAVRRRLAADLRGGPSAQLQREKQLARNDQAELQEALSKSMDKLADSIAQGVERAIANQAAKAK